MNFAEKEETNQFESKRKMIYSSARTIRHRVAFSMAYFVRPFLPAIRPTARERLSPFNGLTKEENLKNENEEEKSLFTVVDFERFEKKIIETNQC